MKQAILEKNKFYHIYNKGRQNENLFRKNENYIYFLRLYEKYIDPIAETYAWVLLGNHFHLLIKTNSIETSKPLSQYFSNLFNAYTKSYNKRYDRYGSLFVSPFKRIEITTDKYFKNLVHYIHNNPVHHGFCDRLQDYPWSSYGSIISLKPTKLQRNKLIGFFDSTGNFIDYHKQNHEFECIRNFLIE
jgi:REP element-mobilizing transposase RayT